MHAASHTAAPASGPQCSRLCCVCYLFIRVMISGIGFISACRLTRLRSTMICPSSLMICDRRIRTCAAAAAPPRHARGCRGKRPRGEHGRHCCSSSTECLAVKGQVVRDLLGASDRVVEPLLEILKFDALRHSTVNARPIMRTTTLAVPCTLYHAHEPLTWAIAMLTANFARTSNFELWYRGNIMTSLDSVTSLPISR